MFSGYKDATPCYDQPFFENRSQASFLPGDTSKQTSGPAWDYSQQPFSTVPCYTGDQNMNHRHPAAIHNPQVVSQFENNSVLAHYKNINTGNNSHQSVVRPRAVINCQSNCNACYNHSVARVPHPWNPPPAESICYITGNSAAPLSGDEISRFAPNLASFSPHEESSHQFTSGFATQLTKLSKFPRDSSPGISSTIAPKNDILSPTEDCSVVRPPHCPSRVEPIPDKYIPPVPSENASAKKDSCVTCHGVCTRPNCKLYHQQTIKFPSLEPLPIQQYGVPRENVVRYTGHSATTLNGGSPSCNQWHQSPGLWLQNSRPPNFWMSASDDIHSMGNAGMTNFWSDRSNCEISGQQVPRPPNYHDMTSNKPAGQVRNHLSLQHQKEGIVREGESSDKFHQSMLQRYQKGTEVPQRYSEMSLRHKDPEETAVSQVYQELLPRRSQQHEALVECGVQYRQDMVSRDPTRVVKSQVETRSNKNDRGHHEPPTVTSELCHQDVTRSHISSDGINPNQALPDFPPTSVDTCTDQVQRDISRKFPATNFAAYLPHDTKVSSSSSSNYSAVLGIAQPPSRFSSNLTYTQSKISRSNNYMRLFSESCLEDSYNPSHSGDMLRNGFVSGNTTATANTVVTSGLSHRHVSFHNRETPNTGMNCSVQIQSPSSNSLPPDPIIRYGTMKDSSEAPPVITTSASVATSQIPPHLQSCGKMLSDHAPPYQTGSRTMQVVESNPACSLGSSAGLNVDPKLLNNSSYISSPHHGQESGVAGSHHVPYQNMLASSRSENVAACNTFCGSNSPMLHSRLFDGFNKNYSNTHVSGPEADMISQSSKENCQITSPNIYSQSNISASACGVKQQLLPLMEDIGASRPIKKRKPRAKGMMKPDQVQLVGKRWHRGRSSQQMTSAPVLDVRQFLATWDEETEDLSPAPRLPDVVLSNSSAENPLLVLDCRNLNTNGMATLSTVDRNSLPEGSPTKSLIHMYQPQLTSPSESSSTSNDTTKSNTQTLQENSNVISQPLGECPSLIPIDPNRMEKFGQPNNCIKSLPEHRTLEQSKSSFYQTGESGKSTPNNGSENSVSKSDLVESLVEARGISVIGNIHNNLDNVCTESDVSNSIPLNECHTSSESLVSETGVFPEVCDSFHGIHENPSDVDSQHSFVVKDECRTNDNSCQNMQGKSKSNSKDCNCLISHQEVPLSCSKIQHPGLSTALEEKHADLHQSRKSRVKALQPLVFNSRTGINTLKALCTAVIEHNTNIKQTFQKGRCSHGKTSNRDSAEKEIQDLEAEICDSMNADKEVEKTCAEGCCSVLKNIADISYSSDHSFTKDVTICLPESTGMPCLIDETNYVSDPKISPCYTPNSNNKVLSQETENISRTEKHLKLSLTSELLAKEKLPENTNACSTEVSHSESSNLTSAVNTKITVNRSLKLFDEAQPPSSFKMKTLNEDMLLNTDAISTDSPVSSYLAAKKLSSTHLPQNRTGQDITAAITRKAPVMTNEEQIESKEQDLKGCSTEPVEPSENERGLEDVNFSVTNESEKNHLNLLSYSSDTGEDLDMSVTSSTPTPVIVEEVDEESGDEELEMMYQDSALSDLESEIRLESDCISFSSLPCISKKPIHEDDTHSNHSLRILESLDRSHTLRGAADDNFPCLVEENFDSEILSDNKDEIARMCALKISGKTDNEKCVSVSSSETKSLGNNTELSPYFKSSLDSPDSCSEDTQIQPMKSPPCQPFMVNHESDSLSSRIKDVSKISDLTSDTALLSIETPDSKTAESDEKIQLESEENNSAEFLSMAHNSAGEACNILQGHEPITNALLENVTYSDTGTKIDCIVVSKPVDCEKHDNPDSLFCNTPAVTADSNQQNADDNSLDKTLPSTQSDSSIVLYEELDLKLAENNVNALCAENVSVDASGKDVLESTASYCNGSHSLVVGEVGKRQRQDCSILNNNSVVLASSSSSDSPACHDRSELAVSDAAEETLKASDELKDSKVSTHGQTEIHFNCGCKQLEIEETGKEVSEVHPLRKGSAYSELLELSENDGTANKSILETTASCSKNVASFMRVLETSPLCGESVEVIQPYQHVTNVKEMPNSAAVCNGNAESPAVHQDCNSNSLTSDVTIRSEDMSEINENNIDGNVPYREDDSDLHIKLNIATDHNCNRSVVPQVSESQNIPKTLPLQNQNFCGLSGEDKLPITAGENRNEQYHKMNYDKNNSIEEPQNKNKLFDIGAISAPIQDNILNSQQTAILNSSTGHSETSDESVSETVPHDYLEIDCEPESTVTRIPCEGTVVADYDTLWNVEPINLSKNTISKWQEDNIPEEKLIARSDRSPYCTESQNVEYLQRNFSVDICHNEQKNVCKEDDAVADDYRNTSHKGENVARSVTGGGGGGGDGGDGGGGGGGDDDDDDDDNNNNNITTIAATINRDDHDNISVKSIVAATEEHLGGNYNTDTNIAEVTDDDTTTTTTAAVTAVGVYCDNTNIDDDGIAVNTTTSAITTDDEADTSRNMDTYTSCKDQSNVPCQNVIQNLTDPETISGTAATTAAATTTATTTTTTTTTTAAAAAAATTTADNTADEDEVCVNVTAATAMFAAASTATAVNTTSGDCDDGSGGGKGLVNCAVGEDWQHEADIQCRNTSQMASKPQKAEQNDTDMEQRHITSMVTSGSITLEEENAAKMPVAINTIENQECCQPEGKHETTRNFRVEQTSKSSSECNRNQLLKFITTCRAPTIPADLSHNSNHIECDGMRKPCSGPESVGSKSQQQDEPNQEKISHCEMDTAANHIKPLQQQCQSAAEPTKDVLINYRHELHDESCALSMQEECPSLEEMHKDKISNCVLDMSIDVSVQQEEHHCLEELIKDEICNSEVNIPTETLMQHEWNSTYKVIKDEINCEIDITSENTAIPHECHSSLELNKEEIGDFKIKTPENVSHSFMTAQDPPEGLDRARVARCTLHMPADSSLTEEFLSLQENKGSISDSEQNSPIGGPGPVQNSVTTLASTKMTVELLHSNESAQNSPYRQEADLSVGTDDMPHLEVIDTEVSPYSSDSLEMPCLDLIADPMQPIRSDQVQYPSDISASVSNIPPLHILPVNMDTGVPGNLTETGVDVQALQKNDNHAFEVTLSSSHSVQKSEGSKDTEMSVLSQDQVTNSVDSELLGKQTSSVLTTYQSSFRLERKTSTEGGVVQKEPPDEGHGCENSSRFESETPTEDGVIQKEPPAKHHGLSPSVNSDVLQDDQNKYLSPEAPVTEECDGGLVKAVECEMQEVSVAPETPQVLSTYLDSGTNSVKVVEVNPEYMEVLQCDASGGLESLPVVTSSLECAPSGEESWKHSTDVTADEEVLPSTDIGKAWHLDDMEDEISLSSAELSVCRTETSFNIEGGPMYSTAKETEALIFEHSESVTLASAALQDTSDEPSSAVYSEMLPGLDPSLGDVLPVDSVSNWPYLEEEVFSEFPAVYMDSSNSMLMVPSSTVVPSIPTPNNGNMAESEASMSSGNNSQYNFRTHSGSNDTAMAIDSLKCCLSWKKIFALSKADRKKKKKKQGTKNGDNPEVIKEDTEFCTKSRQQLKKYSKICHENDGNKLGDKYERLNGNLKSQHNLKNKGVSGLELGPAKIEVRLAPTPSPRGHPKTWRVVDGPKSERILNQGKPNNLLLNASAGNSSCRSVAKDVDPLPSGVTQSPIVLVKRLILKRRSDDESDADSDTKSKNRNQEASLDPNVRNLGSNNVIQVTASSEQTNEAYDVVATHCKRLEDSEHTNSLLKECDLSNSSLMTSISSSQHIETQADGTTDSNNSESEEDRSSYASVVSSNQEAGRKSEVCKSDSSSSIMLSEENDTDGIDSSADTCKTHDICIDDSKHVNVYSDISFSELGSTNSSFSGDDNTKQQLPRVIIKRTIGMGNTNKYRSFLRSASSSSTSSNQWQPIVRLERNLSLDELAKSSAVDSEILDTEKVPDSLQHGLRISLKSPSSQHHVTLAPLPSLACSSVDRNKSRSERSKKWRCGTFPPRTDTGQGNLNDGWNPQRYARKFTSFKSSFRGKHNTCPTSLPKDSGQLSSPKSHLSQKSPPVKLKFFSNCDKMQNGALKMDRNKAITRDSGDEYVVVENRNYTKDSMTKITFQRHKRKEVSVRKECRNIEMKKKEFASNQDIPTTLNQNSYADMLTVHDVSPASSENSNGTFNLTTCPQGTVKRRLSVEHDRESSKTELHHSHKKHMSDVSHDIVSSRQKIASALEDTSNMGSEDCSPKKSAMLNDKPSAVPQPAVNSVTASKDYGPKISTIKKRRYFEDMYLERDVPPLFQPERILLISSTKKKRTSLKEKSPQLDGKALEEEIISLSAESYMDYNEIICKELTEDTDVDAKERQDFSTEGSLRMMPSPEECAGETGSSKDAALMPVSSSEEPERELHKLSDCGSECVGNSDALKADEQQALCNNIEHNVVESTRQGDDACQACGLVYSSHDERTAHIRRHPYHCQRCHLAFRSEVDFVSHLSEQHPRTRERHHCLLCERSFPTAERYKLHLSGRTHRHLELTQRRTIHTLFSVFTGHNCPVLTPLSDSELAGLKWFPVEPGTIHFYHQATPLQRAMQDLLLRKEGNCTNTAGSNFRIPEDYPSKSSDSL